MKVIRHQHVRMQRAVKTLGEFCEVIQEERIVFLGKKAGLPIVSALDDMHWQSSDLKAGFARHMTFYTIISITLLAGSVPIYSCYLFN